MGSGGCGIFATTNAFCLAFGFDLLCYGQVQPGYLRSDTDTDIYDLDDLKKPRMAVEMFNGGFDGDFEYDMLELPSIVGRGQTASGQGDGASASGRWVRRRLSDAGSGGTESSESGVYMDVRNSALLNTCRGVGMKLTYDSPRTMVNNLVFYQQATTQSFYKKVQTRALLAQTAKVTIEESPLYDDSSCILKPDLKRALATTPETATPLPATKFHSHHNSMPRFITKRYSSIPLHHSSESRIAIVQRDN